LVTTSSPVEPGSEHLAGLGIDDFTQEVILVDVQPATLPAFAGHPRAVELGQAVVVGGEEAAPHRCSI